MSYERPEKRPYSADGLTPENMLTDTQYDYFRDKATCHHDITMMNVEQLGKYIRLAFLDQEDLDFLPRVFWEDAFYRVHGSGGGRMPDGATKFFSQMYGFVGRVFYEYPFTQDKVDMSWVDYPLHVEYRQNYFEVMMGIFRECEEAAEPTEEHISLAMAAIDSMIWLSINQGASEDDYTKPDIALFQRAARLASDPRYAAAWEKTERPGDVGWLTQYVDEFGEFQE